MEEPIPMMQLTMHVTRVAFPPHCSDALHNQQVYAVMRKLLNSPDMRSVLHHVSVGNTSCVKHCLIGSEMSMALSEGLT